MAENRELALVLKLIADQFQAEMKKSHGVTSDFANFLTSWKTQLAAVGTALFAVAKSTANFGEEALKGAQKAGQTVETFTALSYAAKLADLDQQQLIVGLKALSQNMVEASQRTGDGEAIFRRLGVSATDAAGQLRPTEQVLLELADVFAKSADGAGKADAAVKLFGKAGLELIPFLNQGQAGIQALMAEAQRLGVVLSKDDAEAAARFNDEIKRMEAVARGLTLQVGNEMLPAMTALLQLLNGPIGSSGSWAITKAFQGLAEVLTIVGAEFEKLGVNIESGLNKMRQPEFSAIFEAQRRLDRGDIDRAMQERLLQVDPKGFGIEAPLGASGPRPADPRPAIPQLADQEELGKALLEIYLAQNRAVDIGNKLRTEGADGYRLAIDRQLQFEQEDQAYQERQGRLIVEQTGLQVRIQEQAAQSERAALVENAKAWVAYYDQVGGSSEGRYQREMDLLRAHLAQQTQLTQEEAGRLLIAWEDHQDELAQSILDRTALTEQQRETLMLNTLRNVKEAQEQNGDIIDGIGSQLRKYSESASPFGLGQDMARRFVQGWESGMTNLIEGFLTGRVRTLKDGLKEGLDLITKMGAQLAAQAAVKGTFSLVSGGFGGFFNNGGVVPKHFDVGGTVMGVGNRDTVAALLTPGEGVLSRRGMAALDRMNQGYPLGGSFSPNISVNVINAPAGTQAQVSTRQDVDSLVIDVLLRHRRDLGLAFGGA